MTHTVTQKIAVLEPDGRIIKWFNHTRSEIVKDLIEQGDTARGPDGEIIDYQYEWGSIWDDVQGGRVVYDEVGPEDYYKESKVKYRRPGVYSTRWNGKVSGVEHEGRPVTSLKDLENLIGREVTIDLEDFFGSR